MSQDYNEAVQFPATHFADPDLCQGQAVTDARRLPMPCSGKSADVYHLRCPGGEWAVRCFTREVPGLRERYAVISAHLGQADLPFMVDCQYLDPGIRVGGAWYPVVKMRWVDGVPLNAFVRNNLGKADVLQDLLGIWVGMARQLHAACVAHGDLRHGTVLSVGGGPGESLKVRLIGYDGMYVPALAGQLLGEVGHPNYQHPQRLRQGTFGPEVDRFPLLVVATALCCLRVAGRGLWERYDNGDNLLFRQADFVVPDKSPLFAELLKLPDPEARAAAARLMAAAQQPLEQTPLLEEVFPEKHPAPAVAPAGVGQKALEQTPRLEPALARKEQQPWWKDAPNGAGKSDAPAPAVEGGKQPPWWEGPLAPRAGEPTASPFPIAPLASPPSPVEETPPPVPVPHEGQAAPQEIASTGYESHPDYRGNLRKKMIGALALAGALLVAFAFGGCFLLRQRWENQPPVAEASAQPQNPPAGPSPNRNQGGNGQEKGLGEQIVPGKNPVGGKKEAGGEAKKADAENKAPQGNKVPEEKPPEFTCAELWAKKPADFRDKEVIVTGPVTQQDWTDFIMNRELGVNPDRGFVGLGKNEQGRAQVICVFPELRRGDRIVAPKLDDGQPYRIKGIYRGPKGPTKVPVLDACSVLGKP
jgi:hypothetical protein